MHSSPIKVLIVDDQRVVQKAIKAFLNEFEDIKIIGEAINGLEAIDQVDRLKPDVVVMDIIMPVMDGIEAIKRIHPAHPILPIIAMTSLLSVNDQTLLWALKAGAMGFILKDDKTLNLVSAIRTVYLGEPALDLKIERKILKEIREPQFSTSNGIKLSNQEIQVLGLLMIGKTQDEISEELFLNKDSVDTEISHLFSKIGVNSLAHAALFSIRSGLVV